MKPGENLNNLSQVPRGAPLDSTTENNSFSSDSDMEVLSSGTADQKRIIQGLKRTIKRNQTKINDLTAKLTVADILLASEKEKTKDKEDLIKSLKLSIDLNTQNKELSIKCMQTQLIELQSALDLSKSRNVTNDNSGQSLKEIESGQYKTKIDELNADIEILESKLQNRNHKIAEMGNQTKKYESNLREKDEKIAKLESQTKLSLETSQKYESNLKEKDEHIAKLESQIKLSLETTIREKDEKIAKLESQMETDAAKMKEMEDKLSKFTLKAETSQDSNDSLVLLNCTKIPSIQIVSIRGGVPFAAVFEDLPSAGPGWMVIQRRVDGSVPFHTRDITDYYYGFGDLSREFWLGCKKLNQLTTSRRHELYIELVDFDNATAFARYDNFVVASEDEWYPLQSLGEYSGNAGDSLRKHEKASFEIEHILNHDTLEYRTHSNGWWGYGECNLNGRYLDHKIPIRNGIFWGSWNIKACQMLIRPKYNLIC